MFIVCEFIVLKSVFFYYTVANVEKVGFYSGLGPAGVLHSTFLTKVNSQRWSKDFNRPLGSADAVVLLY